jgi:SAM-dependent methyltransferase
MDLASSIQFVTEEIIMRMARALHEETRAKNLVLAGGVALNCVANGRLRREGPFDSIWVQPAAGDAGGALGAAMFVWHQLLEKPRRPCPDDAMKGSLLGPRHSTDEIEAFLLRTGAVYRRISDDAELVAFTAKALADEKVVGWFQGRMEFGPRALGSRSILGDPRSARMQATMNVKIKFRESFRPFAPTVLREHAHKWFAIRENEDSPYMLMVAPVLDCRRTALSPEDDEILRTDPDLVRRVNVVRSAVPAITHVDYSARLQTVDERHGRYHRLLKAFYELTGCPILVNTSFNLSWEPIVNTPEEAYRAFMQSEMDMLVLENFVLEKDAQRMGVHPMATDGHIHPDSPWADPLTGDPLLVKSGEALNPVTRTRYPVEDGIPRLFVPNDASTFTEDITETVKAFYEETPFPNYEDLDNPRALLEKARTSLFARLLNDQIPYDARVVEIGCGTGQLTNFLAIAHRSVIGVDVCLNSLRLASQFKTTHGIERATFAQTNLFRPALRDGFFDFVISNGVLHHTSDARRAFQRISRLAKPGGYVVVGLYNAYSRKLHDARRFVFKWTGLTSTWLDPHFGEVGAAGKREAWFRDQYCHPHETSHTLGEVVGWLAESGLEFVNSIPKPQPGTALAADEQLFAPRPAGTSISRALSQMASLGDGYREGGFFIVIARRSTESR